MHSHMVEKGTWSAYLGLLQKPSLEKSLVLKSSAWVLKSNSSLIKAWLSPNKHVESAYTIVNAAKDSLIIEQEDPNVKWNLLINK